VTGKRPDPVTRDRVGGHLHSRNKPIRIWHGSTSWLSCSTAP
jgi:hypothetical protein